MSIFHYTEFTHTYTNIVKSQFSEVSYLIIDFREVLRKETSLHFFKTLLTSAKNILYYNIIYFEMGKRLNVENRFNFNGFKVKVGTTNRLTPNTVYIDLGGYLIPQEEKISYEEDINIVDKTLKNFLKKKIGISKIFDENYICVFETAHERMKKGKTSYISLQCHLKQNGNLNTEDIINKTEILSNEMIEYFIETANDYGFSIKK